MSEKLPYEFPKEFDLSLEDLDSLLKQFVASNAKWSAIFEEKLSALRKEKNLDGTNQALKSNYENSLINYDNSSMALVSYESNLSELLKIIEDLFMAFKDCKKMSIDELNVKLSDFESEHSLKPSALKGILFFVGTGLDPDHTQVKYEWGEIIYRSLPTIPFERESSMAA